MERIASFQLEAKQAGGPWSSGGLVAGESGCFLDRTCDGKQVVDFGRLKELQNTRPHSGGDEPDTPVLAADKMANDEAKTARVDVGDFREVEDIQLSRVTRRGFRLEEVLEGCGSQGGVHISRSKGAGEAKDQGVGCLPLRAFDVEAGTLPDLSGCDGHRISTVWI
jgi:hypothetical protein